MKYDDLLRVPYKAHGKDKSGLDCYGLVYVYAERLGYAMPILQDVSSLKGEEAVAFVKEGFAEYVEKIERAEDNCVCLFYDKGATHTGIHLSGGKLLHATYNHGVVISPLYALQPFAFYRFCRPL